MNTTLTTLSGIGLVLAFGAQARAQEQREKPAEKLETPTHALEFYGTTAYTQGFGSLQSGVDMQRVITPGFATDLGAGYRFDPHWAAFITGQYAEFDAVRANAARGLVVGGAFAYHFLPFDKVDPWVQLGAGYRFLWESNIAPTPDLLTHGFEPARITLGLDVRASRDIAFAPVVGLDLTVPLWQSVNGAGSTAISDPRVSTFVYAGLQARFDLTSRYVGGAPPAPPETHITQAAICPPTAPPPAKPVSPTLSASDEVLEACKMKLDNVDVAPKFDFDKSALLPADVDVLTQVADCFSTGPLKEDRVVLVGRADPRGSTEYNYALGMRRAQTVADFLAQHGVDGARIERTTIGKDEATGTNEATWARDRRVDMMRVEIRIDRAK